MELQSYLKVIKTNNVAKVRNEAVDIVDFSPECGEGVINLSVAVNEANEGVGIERKIQVFYNEKPGLSTLFNNIRLID